MNDQKTMEAIINKTFKPYKIPLYKKIWGVIEIAVLLFFGVGILFSITLISFTLLENPISLAILCATIVLIVGWNR